jgi:4-hydroxy-tetrahydrodipicolinate synthase
MRQFVGLRAVPDRPTIRSAIIHPHHLTNGASAMANLINFCRVATTFSRTGAFDEHAFRQYLQRFIDTRTGVYLGSGGIGEGHTLTWEELRRLYLVGVETCKGKVPVYVNVLEQLTARDVIRHARLAVECGAEAINFYAAEGRHEFKPTDRELETWMDTVLSAIEHPTVLAAQPVVGYPVKARIIADACRRYPHVFAVNLTGVPDAYFLELRDMIDRDMRYYVQITGSLNMLVLGAAGILGGEINIIPGTYRRYIDLFSEGRMEELGQVYVDIKRYLAFTAQWNPAPTRWIKMAMKVLKLPGGEGGIREPYQMPPAEELERFTQGLLKLRIPEIEEQARHAGLRTPA